MQQQYLFWEVYLSYEQDNGQRGNQDSQTTGLFKIMPSWNQNPNQIPSNSLPFTYSDMNKLIYFAAHNSTTFKKQRFRHWAIYLDPFKNYQESSFEILVKGH